MEPTDRELLESFIAKQGDDAFRQLVARHLTMVFATARRMLRDPHHAEEVAQSVFLLLTRKAATIDRSQPLVGWLYRATRHQALHVLRSEDRRRQREQTAAAMHATTTDPGHEELVNELESAMDDLPAEDRDALVLRFLENRNLREVGAEFGVSEDAARKRVNRAADKLRDVFCKRGITVTSGTLTLALAGQAGAAVPVSLGITITSATLAGSGVAGFAATQGTTTIMSLFNLKTAAAVVGAAAITGTSTYLVKENETDRLRDDLQTVTQQFSALSGERQNTLGMIRLRDDQIEQLTQDAADIHRLRGEVDRLNRELAELQSSYASLSSSHRRAYAELETKKQLIADLVAGKAEAELEAEQMVEFEQMWREHRKVLKMWNLQLRIDANDAEKEKDGIFRLVGGKNTEELFRDSKYARSETFNFDNYEQVHFGDDSNGNAIIIRQKEPFVSPDGKRIKLYAFVDGSVQTVAEGFGGYQTFEDFERAHIIPLDQQSPQPR